MKILHSQENLCDVEHGDIEGKPAFFPQPAEQFSPANVRKQHVNAVFVLETRFANY